MKRQALLIFAVVIVFLVSMFPMSAFHGRADSHVDSGASETESGIDWWPMFRHDLNHTGYSTSTAPNTNQTLWNFTTGGFAAGSSPAVADGKVYVGVDANVYALNALDGSLLWNYTTGGWVFPCPAVADGKIFVGSNDTKVYALDALTGSPIWNYTTGSWVWSSPAVADSIVYIGSMDGNLYALNETTGHRIWNYTTVGTMSSPAVANGKVYIGSFDRNIYALNASTGALIWNYTTGLYVRPSPVVVDGMVYAAAGYPGNNLFCALNASTGALIWNYTAGGSNWEPESSPAIAYGRVYIGSVDHKVYALNASTGALIWNYTTGDVVESSPAVADGRVYIGSHDGKFYALDASTGGLVWSYTTGAQEDSSPAVANGMVYVNSADGNVHAFGSLFHDVAVTNVSSSKTVVGQGFSLNITVAAADLGTSSETINVTAFANTTILASRNVTVSSGNLVDIAFTWNTTGFAYGNYTIWAYAKQVLGETNMANNNFTGGRIVVAGKGDLTGATPDALDFVPDGKDDITDVAITAKFFGQKAPPAPSNCDVSGSTMGMPDGKIDITDVATVAKHYGEHYTY